MPPKRKPSAIQLPTTNERSVASLFSVTAATTPSASLNPPDVLDQLPEENTQSESDDAPPSPSRTKDVATLSSYLEPESVDRDATQASSSSHRQLHLPDPSELLGPAHPVGGKGKARATSPDRPLSPICEESVHHHSSPSQPISPRRSRQNSPGIAAPSGAPQIVPLPSLPTSSHQPPGRTMRTYIGKRSHRRSPSPVAADAERITLTRAELAALLAEWQTAHSPQVPSAPPISHALLPAMSLPGLRVPEPHGVRANKRPRLLPPDPLRSYELIDPDALAIPQRVITALEMGMPRYLPLTMLTTAACLKAARAADFDKDMKQTLLYEDGDFAWKPVAFDSSGEDKIALADWIEASGRYITLLRDHLWVAGDPSPGGPSALLIADAWDRHFQLIRRRSNFQSHFACYRLYDIKVRRLWLRGKGATLRPDVWHTALFDHILSEFICSKSEPGLLQGQSVAPAASSGSSSTGGSNKPVASAKPATATGSFRRSSKPTPKDAPFPYRCMYCGSRDHRFKACPGTNTQLQKDSAGRWVDSASASYCIIYNGPKLCQCNLHYLPIYNPSSHV